MKDHTLAKTEALVHKLRKTELAREIDQACARLELNPPKVVPAVADSTRLDTPPQFKDPPLVAADSISAALEEPYTSTILIFGSCRQPGGGWDGKWSGQEEGVSRYGTWAIQAEMAYETYYADGGGSGPVGTHKVLFARGFILRNTSGAWLETPKAVNYLAFAAPNARAFRQTGALWDDKTVRHALFERCATALRLAGEEAPDAPILLGPIGTGSFQLDPLMVANCWREALNAEGCPPGSKMLIADGANSELWRTFEAEGFRQ